MYTVGDFKNRDIVIIVKSKKDIRLFVNFCIENDIGWVKNRDFSWDNLCVGAWCYVNSPDHYIGYMQTEKADYFARQKYGNCVPVHITEVYTNKNTIGSINVGDIINF